MKLRCPYCKETFAPQESNTCPACGKTMRVPTSLKPTAKLRIKPSTRSDRRSAVHDAPVSAIDLDAMRTPITVLTILLVMASLGALLSRTSRPRMPTNTGARIARAQVELHVMQIALQRFHRDCNTYPLTEDGLVSLVKDEGYWGWEGPYLTLMRPDPWSQRYIYAYTNGTVQLYSSGPDGRPGTPDDVFPNEAVVTDPDAATSNLATAADVPAISESAHTNENPVAGRSDTAPE